MAEEVIRRPQRWAVADRLMWFYGPCPGPHWQVGHSPGYPGAGGSAQDRFVACPSGRHRTVVACPDCGVREGYLLLWCRDEPLDGLCVCGRFWATGMTEDQWVRIVSDPVALHPPLP